MRVGGEGKEKAEEEVGLSWGGVREWPGYGGWTGEVSELGFLGIEGVGRSTYREGIFILQQREKWPVLSSPVSFIQLR